MKIEVRGLSIVAILLFCLGAKAQEKPKDWYNLDFNSNKARGISADFFYSRVDSNDLKEVVVAVIDNGVDIYHEDLSASIWLNEDEVPDNNIDDDNNGYIDDIHGWNFLGNPSRENIDKENLEITRLYRYYSSIFDSVDVDTLQGDNIEKFAKFKEIESEFQQETRKLKKQFDEYAQLTALYTGAISYMREKLNSDQLFINDLVNYNAESPDEEEVVGFLLMAESEGLSEYLREAEPYFDSALNYHYNLEFEPRSLVNEELLDSTGMMYGNNMVWAAQPDHGTHVAGIIAANRSNSIGVAGVASNARIMALRAVPDGDERDEDIARAIRYAADNGAQVINMSFGKKYSPRTEMVEEAIDYALSKDVLIVHAAGNESLDIDDEFHYPRGLKKNKKSKKGFLTVGAHTLLDTNFVLASFSNYGIKSVDVLAPGEDIYSTISGNKYKRNSGTSMAAPVVSGMAAVFRGLYPEKSAQQIKKLIRKSIVKHKELKTKIGDSNMPLKEVVRYPGFIDFRQVVD
jgi:subtilisin family serine protease